MASYLEQVKADVRTWLEDNEYYYNVNDYAGDPDGFAEYLNDTLWINDSVTGNGSGSYTFNSAEAKAHVMANTEEVAEALRDFCCDAETVGKYFLNEEWEALDVTARCHNLYSAIYEVMEEDGIRERLENMDPDDPDDETAAEIITAETEPATRTKTA